MDNSLYEEITGEMCKEYENPENVLHHPEKERINGEFEKSYPKLYADK